MKVGDIIDAVALGNEAIDIKGLLKNSGYVVPQVSMAKLPKLPPEVAAEVARIEAEQARYDRLAETKVFECQYCDGDEHNSSQWRRDAETGETFLVCGVCNRVVEVK